MPACRALVENCFHWVKLDIMKFEYLIFYGFSYWQEKCFCEACSCRSFLNKTDFPLSTSQPVVLSSCQWTLVMRLFSGPAEGAWFHAFTGPEDQNKQNKDEKYPTHKSKSLFMFIFIYLVFQGRLSLCFPGCPQTCSVDQDSLEITEIRLPLSPKCMRHHCLDTYTFFKTKSYYITGKKTHLPAASL